MKIKCSDCCGENRLIIQNSQQSCIQRDVFSSSLLQVWGLAVHNLMYSFPGEHAKGSSLFRNISSGVTQAYLSPLGHLFSCGTDGSLKVRQLPYKNGVVNSWYHGPGSGWITSSPPLLKQTHTPMQNQTPYTKWHITARLHVHKIMIFKMNRDL